jgi:hypothetical protein
MIGYPDNIVMIEYDPVESNGVMLFKKVYVGYEFSDMPERPKILFIKFNKEAESYELLLKGAEEVAYVYAIDQKRVQGFVIKKL